MIGWPNASFRFLYATHGLLETLLDAKRKTGSVKMRNNNVRLTWRWLSTKVQSLYDRAGLKQSKVFFVRSGYTTTSSFRWRWLRRTGWRYAENRQWDTPISCKQLNVANTNYYQVQSWQDCLVRKRDKCKVVPMLRTPRRYNLVRVANILNFESRWQLASFTLRTFYPRKKSSRYPLQSSLTVFENRALRRT
jgi:hypothetical protein